MRVVMVILSAVLVTPAFAKPSLPAHYAKLFEQGKRWTYDVSVTTWDYQALEEIKTPNSKRHPWPTKTVKLVGTCVVARTAEIGTSTIAEVTCDRPVDPKFDRTVPGIYVANRRGLHRLNGVAFPATEDDLAYLDLLIAAKPKAQLSRKRDEFAKSTLITGVRKAASGWCAYASSEGAAHDGNTSLCFDGRIGSGRDDVAAELNDVTFRVR